MRITGWQRYVSIPMTGILSTDLSTLQLTKTTK